MSLSHGLIIIFMLCNGSYHSQHCIFIRRNEEVDDKVLIKKLKDKVAELENQVTLLRSKVSDQWSFDCFSKSLVQVFPFTKISQYIYEMALRLWYGPKVLHFFYIVPDAIFSSLFSLKCKFTVVQANFYTFSYNRLYSLHNKVFIPITLTETYWKYCC